jgi:hypothetical protein
MSLRAKWLIFCSISKFQAETVAIDAAEGTELRRFVDDLTLNIGYALTQNLLLVRNYNYAPKEILPLINTGHFKGDRWTCSKIADELLDRCLVQTDRSLYRSQSTLVSQSSTSGTHTIRLFAVKNNRNIVRSLNGFLDSV